MKRTVSLLCFLTLSVSKQVFIRVKLMDIETKGVTHLIDTMDQWYWH